MGLIKKFFTKTSVGKYLTEPTNTLPEFKEEEIDVGKVVIHFVMPEGEQYSLSFVGDYNFSTREKHNGWAWKHHFTHANTYYRNWADTAMKWPFIHLSGGDEYVNVLSAKKLVVKLLPHIVKTNNPINA